MHGTTTRPPQPRESGHARHPHTGHGAEGGGGWPMHATAQPWLAEGRPSSHREVRSAKPTGALRRLLSPGPSHEQGPGLFKDSPFSLNKSRTDQDA
jgi:hypothetical protein